jgi:hypothetical protein
MSTADNGSSRKSAGTTQSALSVGLWSLLIAAVVLFAGSFVLTLEHSHDGAPHGTHASEKPDPTFWDSLANNSIILVGVAVSASLAFLTFSVYRSAIDAITLAQDQAEAGRRQADTAQKTYAITRLSRKPYLELDVDPAVSPTASEYCANEDWAAYRSCLNVPLVIRNVGNGPAIDVRCEAQPIAWGVVKLPVLGSLSVDAIVTKTAPDGVSAGRSLEIPAIEYNGSKALSWTIDRPDVFGEIREQDFMDPISFSQWCAGEGYSLGVTVTMTYRALGPSEVTEGNTASLRTRSVYNVLVTPLGPSLRAEVHLVGLDDDEIDLHYGMSDAIAYRGPMACQPTSFAGRDEERRVEDRVRKLDVHEEAIGFVEIGEDRIKKLEQATSAEERIRVLQGNARLAGPVAHGVEVILRDREMVPSTATTAPVASTAPFDEADL